MKLATLKDGSRDGQLVVVSRDLAQAHHASHIAGTLQRVLDDWNFLSPQLEDLYATLNGGKARHAFAFEPRHCMAPLPRAFRRVAAGPADSGGRPRVVEGASDDVLGACDEAAFASAQVASGGIDAAAGVAVVTGDVAQGADAEAAIDGVRLLLLVNDWALRGSAGTDFADGGGLAPAALACAPVAVTPDELGSAWRGGRVNLAPDCRRNGTPLGADGAGLAPPLHFGALMARLASTRRLRAGSIVGGAHTTVHVAGAAAAAGAPAPARWQFGDTLRVELRAADGSSVFGAIEQRLAALPAA
jgi:fumarylacetoacetate (FAA) hydrolase